MDSETQVMNDQVPDSQPVPVTYADLAAQGNEEAIANDIACMWETHRSMQGTVKNSQRELRALGRTLGEALFFMKVALARPGRNGKWSQFLREKKIPRTTGDRLVAAHERSLSPAANRTDGAIQSPTQDEVRKLSSAVWFRVSKRLSTPESVFWFLCDFALASGAWHEVCEEGILIFRSPREAGVAPCAAASPTETEQAAAVADAGSGSVA